MGYKNKEDKIAYQKQYYLEHKEEIREQKRAWRIANREKHNESNRISYANNKQSKRDYNLKNKEKLELYHKEYYKNNPEKYEKYKETNKIWVKNNLPKLAAKRAKRRASLLQQTPKWADLKAIEEFYKNCPDNHEVDHIIPLKGKNVRGLHVLENLQYLLISENRSKGNRYGE